LYRVDDQQQLLNIKLDSKKEGTAGTIVNCLEFMHDGKGIVTGWSDGQVRAFTPQKGKLLWSIKTAHFVRPFEGSPVKQNS
jgi:WD40 repeat protein